MLHSSAARVLCTFHVRAESRGESSSVGLTRLQIICQDFQVQLIEIRFKNKKNKTWWLILHVCCCASVARVYCHPRNDTIRSNNLRQQTEKGRTHLVIHFLCAVGVLAVQVVAAEQHSESELRTNQQQKTLSLNPHAHARSLCARG